MTKRNSQQYAGVQTQFWENTTSRLLAVRKAARKEEKRRFTNLMHHLSVEQLQKSFYELERNAAAGCDGMSWHEYRENLEERLSNLHRMVQTGRYRPKPARRVFIAKEDGKQRPLSILCLEDKIVQQAVVTLLNQIYEEKFLGFSYGFRPGKGQHDALDALTVGLQKRRVNWVLDLDIKQFFDSVEHAWLIRFIEHRIGDRRLIRLIRKWLKVGTLDEHGHRVSAQQGTPQGAVISPLLANIYLHYAFDLWTNRWRQKQAEKEVIIVRYADDAVLGFQSKQEAEYFLEVLQERLQKFGLALNLDKTRLLRFGRFAAEQRRERNEGKPETFNFLGFTHCCGETREGRFCIKRMTAKKRMRKQLKAVSVALKRRMHEPVPKIGYWLRSVVQGHNNYYAVPWNNDAISLFYYEIRRRWYKALCRRSQRKKINWAKFKPLADRWIPIPKIVHPYPEQRFFATHSR